jgi:hypothetical protein
METTTCGSYKCQREEQCDECFLVDHLKVCAWCELYDHEERKLQVQHLASDYPNDTPSVDDLLAHLVKQTGFRLEGEAEGDRTAADYADAEPVIAE